MRSCDTYTVHEAAKLSDLTETMVNYLCRQGLLKPTSDHKPGRGRARQYNFGDVVMLRALSKLLSAGVSVMKLKTALKAIKKRHSEITPNTLPFKYIVTDGTQVYFRQSGESLEILDKKGQMAFAFVLELELLQYEVNVILKQIS